MYPACNVPKKEPATALLFNSFWRVTSDTLISDRLQKENGLSPISQPLYSVQFVNLYPFSYELLHVPMQARLYHHLLREQGASSHLAVLPFGIVVARSNLYESMSV